MFKLTSQDIEELELDQEYFTDRSTGLIDTAQATEFFIAGTDREGCDEAEFDEIRSAILDHFEGKDS